MKLLELKALTDVPYILLQIFHVRSAEQAGCFHVLRTFTLLSASITTRLGCRSIYYSEFFILQFYFSLSENKKLYSINRH